MALLRQQEYKTKAGELLPREKTRAFVVDILLRARIRMIAMPASQAAPLHACRSVAEVQARLDAAVNDILAELNAPDITGPINWGLAEAIILAQAGGG